MDLIAQLQKLQEESSYFFPNDFAYGDYSDTGIVSVDEVELDEGRWAAYMLTIVQYDGKLWGIEWSRALTENQEHEFYPDNSTVYEVDRAEKVVYTYKKK
jgi:hypothetical protein